MKTINIDLPDDLEKELSLLNRNQQSFILEANRGKIKKKEDLRKELEEGY